MQLPVDLADLHPSLAWIILVGSGLIATTQSDSISSVQGPGAWELLLSNFAQPAVGFGAMVANK
ncbi:hypothetical protein PG993_013556 [Apiospora rasikravindrae]|uniref:Uncharacterized protein n=1 Tax=Apiospora rasikravindrae TaxID=990691 RepID=A0ABR1S052_9PEZI